MFNMMKKRFLMPSLSPSSLQPEAEMAAHRAKMSAQRLMISICSLAYAEE